MDNKILGNELFSQMPIPQRDLYIVYVKMDDTNRITAVNSSEFLRDTEGWIEIDSGYGDRYHHAQGNYFDKPIMDERGIWRYKLVDGQPVERSQKEMDADYEALPPPPPSDHELLQEALAALNAIEEGIASV